MNTKKSIYSADVDMINEAAKMKQFFNRKSAAINQPGNSIFKDEKGEENIFSSDVKSINEASEMKELLKNVKK